MSNVEVVFKLPEDLVERARLEGLLDDAHLAEWLEAQLERRDRIKQLLEDLQKLRSLKPALTQEEIDTEIAAARKAQS